MIQGDVTVTGGLFRGDVGKKLDRAVEQAEDVVAQQAANDVKRLVRSKTVHPTGYYESKVVSERAGTDRMVTDQGVVYGPWLAGVSRRNQTTGYRGIRQFETVAQQIDRKIPALVEPVLDRALGSM
jgi:hypothetical protein